MTGCCRKGVKVLREPLTSCLQLVVALASCPPGAGTAPGVELTEGEDGSLLSEGHLADGS